MYKKIQQRKSPLIYPELSYTINGVLFDVHNTLGGQLPEKYIQKAVATGLRNKGISFKEQYYVPLTFQGNHIGKYYLDFLIEEKIVLELKRGRYVPRNIFNQANKYLDTLDLPLAIIGCFAQDCVVIKRIINQRQDSTDLLYSKP
jgi:GxxExxY protein